jgi:putative ABC transport system permease protein
MASELLFALRALRRWRSGAVAAILTLAIGIAATTSLYALARLGLADFPGVPDLNRVARIYGSTGGNPGDRVPVALNDYQNVLSRATSFSAVGAYTQADATMGSSGDVRTVSAGYASPSFFTVMGVAPTTGRWFTSTDVAASLPVAIVTESLWHSRFGQGRIGEASLVVDDIQRVIVGVMPRDFNYSFVGVTADVWIPLSSAARDAPATVTVYARLRPGVGWPAAAAELSGLARRRDWGWRAIPVSQDARRRATTTLLLTLGPAFIVLLLGCTNVACMVLARGVQRETEFGIRSALGATRRRIVRQLFTENLVLALAGGALGGALAVAILRIVQSSVAAIQPQLAARLSARGFDFIAVALISTVTACLLFGTVPAMRLSKRDIAATLNGVPRRYRMHVGGYGARDLVVFLETASAVGLMIFAALIFTLFGELQRVAPSFAADQVITLRIASHGAQVIEQRIAGLPGVHSTAKASAVPGTWTVRSRADQVHTPSGGTAFVSRVAVDAAFFETMGLPILRGRGFSRDELGDTTGVAVLSEAAVRNISPTQDPLGMTLRLGPAGSAPVVVIGVCRDAMNYGSLSRAGLVPPDVYVAGATSDNGETVVLIRTLGDSRHLLKPIASAAMMPGATRPPRVSIVADDLDFDGGVGFVVWKTFGAFCLIALLLASSGIFGVISQSVAQRTREFGIRLSLGATPHRVLRMVLVREGQLVAAALACGTAITFAIVRSAFAELIALAAMTPMVWAAVASVCGILAGSAVFLATRRIVYLDPMVVLRRN